MDSRITNNKRNNSKSNSTVLKTSRISKQSSSTNASLFGKDTSITKRDNQNQDAVRKSNIPKKSVTNAMPINQIVATDNSFLHKRIGKRRNPSPATEKVEHVNNARETTEMSVQTNECEILDHLLIAGDFKIMTPSTSVTDEIDKLHTFEGHSQKDDQHLADLRAFLDDSSFITRKPPKLRDNILREDHQLIESMDELLQRERPKTESITHIRSRIKQKEEELLSIFGRFKK